MAMYVRLVSVLTACALERAQTQAERPACAGVDEAWHCQGEEQSLLQVPRAGTGKGPPQAANGQIDYFFKAFADILGEVFALSDEKPQVHSCKLALDKCEVAGMPAGESTRVFPGGQTGCLSKKKPEFFFQVIPGDLDKLFLYFQGGGACWNADTGAFPTCSDEAHIHDEGVFDKSQWDNPFSRYTIVNVVYCSGDLHIGNVTHDWGSQRGMLNAMSALNWCLDNFPKLSSFVIGGSSAGSLGAQMLSKHILGKFKGRYDRAVVLADSFVGVADPRAHPSLMRTWGFCDTSVAEEEGLQDRCRDGNLTVMDTFLLTMESLPDVRFASFNCKTDIAQIAFSNLWSAMELDDSDKPLILGGAEFYSELNKVLARYDKQPHHVSYLVNSDWHTFLQLPEFYDTDPNQAEEDDPTAKDGHQGGTSVQQASGKLPTLVEWVDSIVRPSDPVHSVCAGELVDEPSWKGERYCDRAQYSSKKSLPAAADLSLPQLIASSDH